MHYFLTFVAGVFITLAAADGIWHKHIVAQHFGQYSPTTGDFEWLTVEQVCAKH